MRHHQIKPVLKRARDICGWTAIVLQTIFIIFSLVDGLFKVWYGRFLLNWFE